MSPEPFDSRAKAPPAKRWEKGYGDENEKNASNSVLALGCDILNQVHGQHAARCSDGLAKRLQLRCTRVKEKVIQFRNMDA